MGILRGKKLKYYIWLLLAKWHEKKKHTCEVCGKNYGHHIIICDKCFKECME